MVWSPSDQLIDVHVATYASLSSSNQLTGVGAGAVQPDDDLALVSPASQALECQLNLLQVEDPLSNLYFKTVVR